MCNSPSHRINNISNSMDSRLEAHISYLKSKRKIKKHTQSDYKNKRATLGSSDSAFDSAFD